MKKTNRHEVKVSLSSSYDGVSILANGSYLVVKYTDKWNSEFQNAVIRFCEVTKALWVSDHYCEADDIGESDAITECVTEDQSGISREFHVSFDHQGSLRVWADRFEIEYS